MWYPLTSYKATHVSYISKLDGCFIQTPCGSFYSAPDTATHILLQTFFNSALKLPPTFSNALFASLLDIMRSTPKNHNYDGQNGLSVESVICFSYNFSQMVIL